MPPLLKLQWLFILLRSKQKSLHDLGPHSLYNYTVIYSPSSCFSNFTQSLEYTRLPYSLSLPDHLSLDSQHQFSLQIFTCLISMFYFLLYSACKFLLLCFVFFIIMPIILQYTIVYNLLFFPHWYICNCPWQCWMNKWKNKWVKASWSQN